MRRAQHLVAHHAFGDGLAKVHKQIVKLFSEGLFDNRDRLRASERRHAVLKFGQRVGDLAADDIRPLRPDANLPPVEPDLPVE